jgi:hypothetical protein
MKVIKQYFFFYLTIAVLYTLWSFLLDLVLYNGDYGGKGVSYFFWFVFSYAIFTVPVVIIYNLFINFIFKDAGLWIRILIAVLYGLLIYWILGDLGPNYIVGPSGKIKMMILYPLVGVSAEIIRNYIVKKRYTHHYYNEIK